MNVCWAACAALDRRRLALPAVFGVALLLRAYVATQPHSGEATPPKFGDYEAQRHWMVRVAAALPAPAALRMLDHTHADRAFLPQELALHTPPSEWYITTPRNNLSYWGLDYPPLSGYQSWLCGKAVAAVEPAAVALGTSHGYETPSSKRLLRATVLAFDVAVFLPGALLALRALHPRPRRSGDIPWALALVALQPAFVLIDHGHFQYNNISLGLSAAAAAAILRGRHVIGSVLYTLAFNHKQMALFYAPAFFAHLLGRCVASGRPVRGVATLGVAVIGTMVAVWAPFLRQPGPLAVATRLAPIGRGVFEDHVASLWRVPMRCSAVCVHQASFRAHVLMCLHAFISGVPLRRCSSGSSASATRRWRAPPRASPWPRACRPWRTKCCAPRGAASSSRCSTHRSRPSSSASRCTKRASCCRCCLRRCWRWTSPACLPC